MILLILAAQAATLGAANYSVSGPMPAPKGKPSFADEFDGKAITRPNGASTSRAMSKAKLVSREPRGYGIYEVRAKLPCGRGSWPAVWLLPSGGTWPDEGELDMMEMVGWDAGIVHATVHSGAFNHVKGTQRGAQARIATACTAYHRYQLDVITIGVDGHAIMRVANDQPGGKAAWPFTRPYDVILNLAVGGDWGGQKGIDDGAFPQRMAVDYVRYWRLR